MSKSGVELLALSTPPSPARLPCLPSPPRAPAFTNDVKENYVLTTHIIQAAFPRTTPPVRAPAVPSPDLPFKDRQAGVKEAAAKALALRVDYQCGRLTQERDSRPLWMCANRYARKKVTGKGLTLVLMHANGFTKETWEPVLDRLLSYTSGIHEVWCLEAVQHGDSALINRGNIGGVFSWHDQARDLLNFLISYLPDMASQTILPLHLSKIDSNIALRRQEHGFENRTIVGGGHSFGGVATFLAATTHPTLFSSIISIEAVVGSPQPADYIDGLKRVVAPVMSRRSVWDSRSDARADLARYSGMRGFNPSQIDIFIETALCDRPDGRVQLKQDPVDEAIVFEIYSPGVVWTHVGKLDERVDVHWIRGSKPTIFAPSLTQGDEFIRRSEEGRGGRGVSSGLVEGHHVVIQENPEGVAQEMWKFLRGKYAVQVARL